MILIESFWSSEMLLANLSDLDHLVQCGDPRLGIELGLACGVEGPFPLDDLLSPDDLVPFGEVTGHQLVRLGSVILLAERRVTGDADDPVLPILVDISSVGR